MSLCYRKPSRSSHLTLLLCSRTCDYSVSAFGYDIVLTMANLEARSQDNDGMLCLTLKDSNELFYKDFGNTHGTTVVFSHGWPLRFDNWENQMFFLGKHGCRVVDHDRRGHERSSQPLDGKVN